MKAALLWTIALGVVAYGAYALVPDLRRELKIYSM